MTSHVKLGQLKWAGTQNGVPVALYECDMTGLTGKQTVRANPGMFIDGATGGGTTFAIEGDPHGHEIGFERLPDELPHDIDDLDELRRWARRRYDPRRSHGASG